MKKTVAPQFEIFFQDLIAAIVGGVVAKHGVLYDAEATESMAKAACAFAYAVVLEQADYIVDRDYL